MMGLIYCGTFDHEKTTGSVAAEFNSSNGTGAEFGAVNTRNGHAQTYTPSAATSTRSLWSLAKSQQIPNTLQAINILSGCVYVTTLPGAGVLQRWVQNGDGGTNIDAIGVDENGKVFVRDATGANILSANVFATGAFYWYSWRWDNTGGARHDKLWMRKLDGIDAGSYWIDSIALTVTAPNMRYFSIGPIGAAKGSAFGGYTLIIPPIWMTSAGAVNNAVLTDEHDVAMYRPTGEGHTRTLKDSIGLAAPGLYTDWNETPLTDANFNYNDTVNDAKQFSTITATVATAPIGVCVRAWGRAAAVGVTRNAALQISDGTNDSADGGCENTTTAAPLGPAAYDMNPSGGAWAIGDIPSLQIGAHTPADVAGTNRKYDMLWVNIARPLTTASVPPVPTQIPGGKGPLLRPQYDHLADLRAGPTGDTLRDVRELQQSIERTTRQLMGAR